MVDAFTITEMYYLITSLFCDLVPFLSYLSVWYYIHWLRRLPCFRHSDKSGYGFPNVLYHNLEETHQANYF